MRREQLWQTGFAAVAADLARAARQITGEQQSPNREATTMYHCWQATYTRARGFALRRGRLSRRQRDARLVAPGLFRPVHIVHGGCSSRMSGVGPGVRVARVL